MSPARNNGRGYSGQRDKNGNLKMPSGARYTRFPTTLLNSDDFLSLDPMALKIYLIMLRTWRTYDPDTSIKISYKRLRELCTRTIPDGNGSTKVLAPSMSTISKAVTQLESTGFIEKLSKHKVCNEYWIEQKWFTGEYK